MQILKTIAEFRAARRALTEMLGFVPTMGYLHEGHISLVERAKAENTHVAASIFVNPTQFGPGEDFTTYPRDPARDLAMFERAGVDFIYMPPVEEMYPPDAQTAVDVVGLSTLLEGEHRPGHFRGVATVIAKLFNIVTPDRAYFGQKDAQQVAVIRRMTQDLNFPIEIVAVPTRRAPDGVALSSRNVYLNKVEREAAPILIQALSTARDRAIGGERNGPALRKLMEDVLSTEPLAQVEYVSAADADTLQELDGTSDRAILLSMAVRFGKTRLIDNVVVPAL